MSVTSISNNMVPIQGLPVTPTNRRSVEDGIGRQLEQDLQSGDLQGAQQAWKQLAAYGQNNSGPFSDPTLQSEFQTLGSDLASGNLAAAQGANSSMTATLMHNDMQAVVSDYKSGSSDLSSAVQNLKGDYWAVFGQQFDPSQLVGMDKSSTPTAVSIQA
jgi:hypothetical protein